MRRTMLYRIIRIEPLADHKLWLEFEDGESNLVDFAPTIERGGVFDELASPGVFAQARIGEAGRYIEWPGTIDFCADALREKMPERSLL